MTKSKWSSTVREAYPVDCQTFLTSIISDGKQAAKDIGDKVAEVGDEVQVVIDGAQGLSGRWSNFSNFNCLRLQASSKGHR